MSAEFRLPLGGRALRRAAAVFFAAGLTASAAWLHRRASAASSESLLADLVLTPAPDGARVSDVSRLTHVTVLSVVDGDTLKIEWNGRPERLRYYGVNTPERGDACYEEATARNAALAGGEVLLAFDARARDKYDRVLAYVFTPEGASIDAALVAEGLGRAWTRDGRWRDAVQTLESEARAAKRGCLWAAGASATRRGGAHDKRRSRSRRKNPKTPRTN